MKKKLNDKCYMCVFFFEENYKDDCKGDYY